MQHQIKSMRPFIGAKNYDESRSFYTDLGFTETVLSNDMSVFKIANFAFYLQKSYIKDWVDNSQIFLEVNDVEKYFNELAALNLQQKYKGKVRLTAIKKIHGERNVLYMIHQEFYGISENFLSINFLPASIIQTYFLSIYIGKAIILIA